MGKIEDGIKHVSNAAKGKIEGKGKIGDTKTKGSIDTKGVVELGVDFKVGGLGITTDYGGGIKVSIAGQSITWGRTGGKIHYNIGGFEVIVEARNCVVTETKKIMGMVVASHTYPDPGCKLPEPPKPPKPSIQSFDEQGINLPETGSGWVFYKRKFLNGFPIFYGGVSYTTDNTYSSRSMDYDETFDASFQLPFAVAITNTIQGYITQNKPSTTTSIVPKIIKDFRVVSNVTHGGQTATTLDLWTTGYSQGREYPGNKLYIFRGEVANIKEFISLANTAELAKRSTSPRSDIYQIIPLEFIPFNAQAQTKPQPFLQPGVPPNMNDDCCEEILEALDDLKEVIGTEQILLTKGKNRGRLVEEFVEKPKRDKLTDKTFTNYSEAIDGILSELQNFEKILHADFFQEKKFPVPTNLLIPGVEDGSVEATSYYHLVKHLFQALAHGTIINPLIKIQDTDAVKEGDQTLDSKYLSATGWAEAVTKMLYEIVDDGNVGTNMDIRTGVTVTQLLVAVADLSYKIDCIIDCIGVTTKRAKGEVETSYNLVLDQDEKIKGFDPKKANKPLDLNDDMSTEKLLSSLLKTRKNPIVKEEIHPKASSLVELIKGLKQ